MHLEPPVLRENRAQLIKVEQDHFLRTALEIGHSGDKDTLTYDLDSGFIKEKAAELAALCINLFHSVNNGAAGKPAIFMNGLSIPAERLLVPSGSHGGGSLPDLGLDKQTP